MSGEAPKLSVVVPSYEGGARVRRLLSQLASQTLRPDAFEVVVVDDGSPTPLWEALDRADWPFALSVLRQQNAGAAAARHLGATRSRGRILLFVDDDMEVPEDFVESHAAHHTGEEKRVLLGRMRAGAGGSGLMERWHQLHLDRKAAQFSADRGAIRGNSMFSGNVSMRREDYFAAGGFDATLRRGHDMELGLRLEKIGARFEFSEKAWSRHAPDPHGLPWWRERAMLYGRIDRRIWRKHPEARHASPWRWLRETNPLIRPFIALALRAPEVAKVVGSAVLRAAHGFDAVRLDAVALKAVTVAYTMDYFRGVRAEIGPLEAALAEAGEFQALGATAR